MPYDKKSFILGLAAGLATQGTHRNPAIQPVSPGPCIVFSSQTGVALRIYNSTKNWLGSLQYSINKTDWIEWDGSTKIVSVDNYICLRGKNNRFITGHINIEGSFILEGANIYCSGDIRTLLDYEYPEQTVMDDACFHYLFYGNSNLISAPQLPATTLSRSCYASMFNYCSRLQEAPELPAMSIPGFAYHSMFTRCSSLINPPALPATEVGEACYYEMFLRCTALTAIPQLPALVLQRNCYRGMFGYCSNIKVSSTYGGEFQTPYRVPQYGNGQMANYALNDMFGHTGGSVMTPQINTTYYTPNRLV